MRKVSGGLLGLVFFMASINGAFPQSTGFLDGNRLLKLCRSTDPIERGQCVGYIMGVADAANCRIANNVFGGISSHPPGVTNGQAGLVVIKWLRAHPELTHFPAANLISLALSESWPC